MNVPEPNSGELLEIKAVFEIPATEAVKKSGVWTGRIESAVFAARVVNPKLKTPQEYIWNRCPEQALRLMKEDPSWIHDRLRPGSTTQDLIGRDFYHRNCLA